MRFLAALKRELKALDRGSSKRIWYAVVEHIDQARLSKELVTLHEQVEVEFEPEKFALTQPSAAGFEASSSRSGSSR